MSVFPFWNTPRASKRGRPAFARREAFCASRIIGLKSPESVAVLDTARMETVRKRPLRVQRTAARTKAREILDIVAKI